jgi:peptidoglycan hydrolase CwlO-like protein
MLLDIAASLTPTILYNLAAFITLMIGLVGSFFNLKNSIALQKSEIQRLKEDNLKLELRIDNFDSKIQTQIAALDLKLDSKIGGLYDKIEKLPQDLSALFKNILNKNS